MGEWRVQRTNYNATPPRNEWLARKPAFDPGVVGVPADPGDPNADPPREPAPEVLEVAPSISDVVWTSQRADGTWRNGPPHDFGRRRAERWASMIADTDVIPVRFGAPDVDENGPDPATAKEEVRREARRAYRKALAEGGEPL